MSKYHSRKTVLDGITFDSGAEGFALRPDVFCQTLLAALVFIRMVPQLGTLLLVAVLPNQVHGSQVLLHPSFFW